MVVSWLLENPISKMFLMMHNTEKKYEVGKVEPVKEGSQEFVPDETTRGLTDESVSRCTEHDVVGDKIVESSSAERSSSLDASSSRGEGTSTDEVSLPQSGRLDQQSARAQSIEASKHEGASDALVTIPAAKQAETSAPQRSSRGVPKAPTSQYAGMNSDITATTTPTKASKDGSKTVTFQFGSISLGFMNGMQIPDRTSSSPPNLDEQKRDQAGHNSFRAVPSSPAPNVPKQQLPRKDSVAVDQPNSHEVHPVPKVKKDVQVSLAPLASQNLKPSGLPMTGISMSIPFHQPQVSMQFGPNQQMQTQGVTASSLQMPMPMPLQMESAQVQQPVFVPGLQPHPMQHQGIMHQGQNLSVTTQMAQLPPQLSNLGMGIAPQYTLQSGGKYSARKTTVKITNPKTNEELRIDKRSDGFSDGGSSGPRPHHNVPPQSQPIPSFEASHPMNNYTPYNASNLYFPTPSSVPLTGGQMAPSSQAPRFNYQGSQGPQNVTIMNPSALNSLPVNKSGTHMHGILEPPNLEHACDIQNLVSSVPSATTHVTVKPGAGSAGEKVEALSNNSAIVEKSELPKPSRPPAEFLMMHKTEKKYEVGKVVGEEEAKQRQFRAILNKLTPQNFEKLFEQVEAVNIDNVWTLCGVVGQIFDRAVMEPIFCEVYVNFCYHLSGELPDFNEDNEKITFKRLLLNKCQYEFERGEREQEEANKADEEGEVKQSKEEREEKRIKARRRMLGNIRLIGELYKKKMLTERIMHECIKKLLGQQHQTPDEEDVEALCKLMSTIGEIIDHPKAKEHMDAYFEGMKTLSNNMKVSSRVRFMLKDAIDLRKNKWQQRRKVEGPKKIEEVHRDAAQEQQAQTSRLARGPGINPSGRRGPPMDNGPRGSAMLSSPSSQLGGFRTFPAQVRGFGSQDVRVDERQPFEARTLSVPLTQRPIGDDTITLGPQGGLARGMSFRGLPSMSSASLADISASSGDSRRVAAGSNGYGSISDRAYSPREDLIPTFVQDRFSGQSAYDQSSAQERNVNYGGRDLRNSDTFDRNIPTMPPSLGQAPSSSQNTPLEKIWPEERLREKSIAAIKEFYSARDEKEVTLCIKELNSPSFHPTMISIWITDSFERKDLEIDLLAKLLVNLTKSPGGILSQSHLIKGFESVLATLEDTIIDAPKAPQYLGRIFAKIITENVASLGEIGQLLHRAKGAVQSSISCACS